MALTKIIDSDLVGKGVAGQADTPGLTASEMQAKVEELSRAVVIPKFNALSTELDTDLSQRPTNSSMQAYVDAKVIAAGAGDMLQSVYDPAGYARQMLPADGDAGNASASFSVAEADADIASGEKLSVLFGKIKKRFAVWAARLANVGAPNLLDNSNFKNPVNQRGAASYTAGYSIDRWMCNSAQYTVATRTLLGQSDASYLFQPHVLSAMGKGEMCYSVRADGVVYSLVFNSETGTSPATLSTPFGQLAASWDSASDRLFLRIYAGSGKSTVLDWAKLEWGAVPTPYAPKGFAAELAECVRYYRKIDFWLRAWSDASGANCTLPFGLPMRAVPSATVSTGYTNNMASVNTAVGAASVAVLLVPTTTGMVHANGSVTLTADL